MSKALVLGADPAVTNIGTTIAARLGTSGWDVSENSGWNEHREVYEVPPMLEYRNCEALVVTLGQTAVDRFHEQSNYVTEDVIRACLLLPLLAAKEYMTVRRKLRGTVVFVGSYAHDHPITNGEAYCAAKAGLAAATKVLAWDYSPEFSFHIVHPYHTPGTPMWERVQAGVMEARGWTREQADDYAMQNLRQPEMLTPREIAEIVEWLLTAPAAKWLSGQGLNLYGGSR